MTPLQTLVAGVKHKGQKAKEGERQKKARGRGETQDMKGLKEPFAQGETGHTCDMCRGTRTGDKRSTRLKRGTCGSREAGSGAD